MAWWCEAIQANEDPVIQQTNTMVAVAQRDLSKGKNIPFWTRGLVPSAWVPRRDPISPNMEMIGNLRDLVFGPKVGTDGSGGTRRDESSANIDN